MARTPEPADSPIPVAAQRIRSGTANESPDLAGLLSAAAVGDRNAFSLLYANSSAQLFAVVLRILKRRSWAEEVLQDAYIAIWTHAGSYAPERGSAMAWMIAIARNRAIDVYRRERTRPNLGHPADLDDWIAPDANPLDHVDAGDDARALWHCLGALDEKQRDSILLAYRDGYTHAEIAARLDSPLGTIKSWIRRGQVRLKMCLER